MYALVYYVKPAMNTENMMWLAGMGGQTATQPVHSIAMALAKNDAGAGSGVSNEADSVPNSLSADQLLNTQQEFE